MIADRSSQTLGTGLIVAGLALAALVVIWLVVNAAAGILGPGGFVLGLLLLLLFVLPLLVAGVYVRQRGEAQTAQAEAFRARRSLLERDRLFRQSLRREVERAAQLVGARASEAEGVAVDLLRQTRDSLVGLEESAAQQPREADWMDVTTLGPRDERDVERYDDLLLAGIRRIRETAEQPERAERPETAREMLDLARSAARQFDLRQDLLLRGRRLPPVAPLHLLRAEVPGRRAVAPEDLRPGGAVSRESMDYLVTARVSYFDSGRQWYALVLRGEEGERRLQLEPGADRVLWMEPVAEHALPDQVEESGTASVAIDSLSGQAEGVVVDYRRTEGAGGRVGWWERWPQGERSYAGQEERLAGFEFWPVAVGSA